jgi:flavin-dependent dehydrogenase
VIDLIVVGAGPAGLASATAAASRGLDVVVIDRREGVIDKPCGEGLMPGSLATLDALGVAAPVGRDFHGIRYVMGDVIAEGRLPGRGRGVRRTTLHHALSQRALAVGVRREVGEIAEVRVHDDRVVAGGFEARWLIAADGLRSSVRRSLNLDRPAPGPRRYGLVQHFRVAPWADTVDVHWNDDAEAYVTPVAPDLVGIAILFGDAARSRGADAGKAPYQRLLAGFPDLRARIHDATHTPKGAGPFSTRSARRVAGRVLLVGDAAGFVDPITGEGIKLGLQSAVAAVDAIIGGDPSAYELAWRRLFRPYLWMTRGLLEITRHRAPRRQLPRLLRTLPSLFDTALSVLAR